MICPYSTIGLDLDLIQWRNLGYRRGGNVLWPPMLTALSLWPSGIGSRLGWNRLWIRFLAVSDIYPMFIEPTITWVLRGSLGTYGLTQKLCWKQHKGGGQTMFPYFFLWPKLIFWPGGGVDPPQPSTTASHVRILLLLSAVNPDTSALILILLGVIIALLTMVNKNYN